MAGLWTLIKLILRRDRIKLPLWIICIVAFLLMMVPLLQDVYSDDASLALIHQTLNSNPAGRFLTGPMDTPTLGAFMTVETLLWWGMAVAFMNTLLVMRHTRQNEETGAQELILSGQVRRSTSLVAVLVVAAVANLIIAVGLGAGLAAFGDVPWNTDQAWLYGIAMGAFGFVFAAIAAIIAQLMESARSANGIAAGVLGAAFLVRGIGDFLGTVNESGILQPAWISWLSPFGWMQLTRPLTNPDWWPLLVPLGFILVVLPIAFLLLAKRDVGAGILPTRKGRARASAFLQTPLGLTWHLQKNIFIGWLISTLVLVLIIGILVPEMSRVYETSESMKLILESMGGVGEAIPSFLSAMLSITALMVTAYVIQAVGKLRSEEYNGYLENVLATRLSRIGWFSLHVGVAIVGATVMLALAGATMALCVNLVSSGASLDIWQYTLAGLSYVPMQLVFIGLYGALFGILPRLSGVVVWIYFGFVAFMSWIGPILNPSQWVKDLVITTHVAAPPLETVSATTTWVLLAVFTALMLAGGLLWRHRNLLER